MKRCSKFVPALVLSTFIVVCSSLAAADELKLEANQIQAMGLEFSSPERISRVPGAPWPGRVKVPPTRQAELIAPVTGRVRSVQRLHGSVQVGELLLELESDELRQAQQAWLETLAELALAEEEYQRAQRLYKIGSMSRKKFLQARNRHAILKDRAGAQRSDLRFSGMTEEEISELEKARDIDGVVRIRAPRDGVLAPMVAVPGQEVQRGERLSVISDASQVVVNIPLPISEAEGLEVGQGVMLERNALQGRVVWIAHEVDAMTQRVVVHARFDNAVGRLLPGELVLARFLAEMPEGQVAWRLPATGLVELEGAPTVFRRTEQGVEPLSVEVLTRDASEVVVRPSGSVVATPDVQLLTRGAVYLKPMIGNDDE